MSKTREQINDWLKMIDVAGKSVLDVGAGRPRAWLIPPEGEGKPKVKGKPKEYKTLDINPEFGCDFEADLNELIYFTEKGSKENDVGIFERHKYDIVFCLETLEHLWNPREAIFNISNFLKEGGMCYLSAPLVNPIHDTHDYLRFTFQWFEKVLPQWFKEAIIIPRVATDEEGLHKFYVAEGMRMSKISRKLGYSKNYFDIGYCVEARK